MDVVVPMASQPTAMASRNWMMRRMLIETIKQDPEYNNGNYTSQPRIMKIANVFYAIGTSSGNLALQKAAPTAALADKLIDARLAAPLTIDTNDYLYAWESSRDYDAGPGLDRIKARCSRSTPPTTSATRRSRESWSAS
jgi:homoserine O-acetyltransferase